jgi:hypothetical protein
MDGKKRYTVADETGFIPSVFILGKHIATHPIQGQRIYCWVGLDTWALGQLQKQPGCLHHLQLQGSLQDDQGHPKTVVLTKSDSLLLCGEEYVYIQGTSKIFEIFSLSRLQNLTYFVH